MKSESVKFSFCLLNCQRWFTVHMYTYFIEGSWSPAPHQLSHLEYSSKAPKTTEAILSGVIWTENHLFWKLSEIKLVNSIWFFPELFPLVHMCSNVALIKEREGKPKRLDKVILTAGDKWVVKLLRKALTYSAPYELISPLSTFPSNPSS